MSLDVNISENGDIKNSINLYQYIKVIADEKGIDDFDYTVEYVGGKNDHYVANIFRVQIKDNVNGNNQVNVIVKTLVSTVRQEHFHELHKREVQVYSEVIPEFNLVLNNLNYVDGIVFPRCLLSNSERGEEVIILEDMIEKGFENDRTFENYEFLKYETVCAAINNIAEFHALSIILEKQNFDKYSDLKLKFQDLMFDEDYLNRSKNNSFILDLYQDSVKQVKNEEYKRRLDKLELKLFNLLRNYTMPGDFNVLCHGDYWLNNVIFKSKEDQISTCLLDFQVLRYANPATDIVYFLYLCTDSKFRSEYMKKLLKVYYDKLVTMTALAEINLNTMYSEECFLRDIKEYTPFGVLMAMIQMKLTIHSHEENDLIPLPPLSLRQANETENSIMKIKINDLINECVAKGVLDILEHKSREV